MFGIDMTGNMPYKITNIAPVPNVIFGMTLKDMNKIEFNDFGTLFADPTDLSSNITSIGIWTKELTHPKDLRYPDNLGELKPLSLNILTELSEFAKSATKELYIDISKWNFNKKLMFGSNLYVNRVASSCAQFAGIEDNYNWSWPFDYAAGKPLKTDLVDKEKIDFYIDVLGEKVKTTKDEKEATKLQIASLEKYKGIHPFLPRMFRSKRVRKLDPFYYFLQDE
jgi:hypothetical protein